MTLPKLQLPGGQILQLITADTHRQVVFAWGNTYGSFQFNLPLDKVDLLIAQLNQCKTHLEKNTLNPS